MFSCRSKVRHSKCTPQIIEVVLSHNGCHVVSQADTITQFRDSHHFIDQSINNDLIILLHTAQPHLQDQSSSWAPAPSALPPPSPPGSLSCWSFPHPSPGHRGRAEGCLQSPGAAVVASTMSRNWAPTPSQPSLAALCPQAPRLPLQGGQCSG